MGSTCTKNRGDDCSGNNKTDGNGFVSLRAK